MGLPTQKENDDFFDESKADIEKDFEKIETRLKYYDFDKSPKFMGTYLRQHIADGEVAGYVFEDKTGNDVIIGASFNIVNALTKAKEGEIYLIHFLGKDKLPGGKTVNKFDVYRKKA